MSASNPKKILVVGATGGVGRFISEEVMRMFGLGSLVVGDYRRERGAAFANELGAEVSFRCVDVTQRGSIENAVEGVDAVIVAVQQVDPVVQSVCLESRIPCLDVTLNAELLEKARTLDAQPEARATASIMMAGLIPGLSGVMVKHVVETLHDVSAIDVGLLQSSQGSAGTMGIADMLGAFAQSVEFRSHGTQHVRPGFTVKREMEFPQPFGIFTQRLINYVEAPVVAAHCGVHDVNYWTGFDRPAFEMLVVCLNKVGLLRLFNLQTTRKGLATLFALTKRGSGPESETIALSIEVSGSVDGSPRTRTLGLVGPSDYGTTAICVVSMTRLLLENRVEATGICLPMEVFTLDSLVEAMDCDEVTLHWLDS
ncbi:MAG: SDR family NAD(P)-dependent oxidoreductase [Halieaceae bacterium]|nr:SDR family NAD(P)-dependent oxidoreductase [Halieaceae bacterium]